MMDSEIFAEFLARQGYRIIQTQNTFWYNAQPGFYFYFPYHHLINPPPDELLSLKKAGPFIGARYFSPPAKGRKHSFLIVCDNKNYDLSSVDRDYARRQTRRGLENVTVKQVACEELAEIGLPLVRDTLVRQKRSLDIWRKDKWKLYCNSTKGLEGFEAWGAYHKNQLTAFLIGFLMEDHFTILHHSSATRHLSLYPNNALIFTVTQKKIASPLVNSVFYGPESLDAPQSLTKFKFRMGYKPRNMEQEIFFNPVIKPLLNPALFKFIHLLSIIDPASDTWRKMEGLIAFSQNTQLRQAN